MPCIIIGPEDDLGILDPKVLGEHTTGSRDISSSARAQTSASAEPSQTSSFDQLTPGTGAAATSCVRSSKQIISPAQWWGRKRRVEERITYPALLGSVNYSSRRYRGPLSIYIYIIIEARSLPIYLIFYIRGEARQG